MFVRITLEIFIVVGLIVAFCYEDKFIQFEQDCRAISHACKRQGINARDLFKLVRQGEKK